MVATNSDALDVDTSLALKGLIEMILEKCPKCKGNLLIDTIRDEVDLHCVRCGRGWKKQPNGTWHSRFTATLEILNTKGEYIDR